MEINYTPIKFKDGILTLLDQRKLPLVEEFVTCVTLQEGYDSIKDMVVRGAPCIGFTAIYSLALWLKKNQGKSITEFKKACDYLKEARPTAVNLQYEIDRVFELIIPLGDIIHSEMYNKVVEFGHLQITNSEFQNRTMAKLAHADLAKRLGDRKYRILTHCNTGFLACGSIGTALGVVQHLGEQDKIENVWVDETRPYLQGARLTAYELVKLGLPHKIVVEGAASYLMREGLVDAIFTGADRIVANGDTANKVGTSNLAILAKYYGIPFYIVAPSSSFDMETSNGSGIEIELRPTEEITKIKGQQISPLESQAFNPSFDITEGELITGIISEKGIALGSYENSLKEIV